MSHLVNIMTAVERVVLYIIYHESIFRLKIWGVPGHISRFKVV